MATRTTNKFALLAQEPKDCNVCEGKHYSATCPFICTFCFKNTKKSGLSSQTLSPTFAPATITRTAILVDGKDIRETVHHSQISPEISATQKNKNTLHHVTENESPSNNSQKINHVLHISSECPLLCPLCPEERHHYRKCGKMCKIHKYTEGSYAHTQSNCPIECFWCHQTGHTKRHCISLAAHIERKQQLAPHGSADRNKEATFKLSSNEDFPSLLSCY